VCGAGLCAYLKIRQIDVLSNSSPELCYRKSPFPRVFLGVVRTPVRHLLLLEMLQIILSSIFDHGKKAIEMTGKGRGVSFAGAGAHGRDAGGETTETPTFF